MAAVEYEKNLPDWMRAGRTKPWSEPTARSQTGIVGVHPYKNRSGNQAGYRASWVQTENGKRKHKTKDFSFFAHGNRALSLALNYRRAMVAE